MLGLKFMIKLVERRRARMSQTAAMGGKVQEEGCLTCCHDRTQGFRPL
jgi:hypothetical protein